MAAKKPARTQENPPASLLARVAHGLYGHLACIQGFSELMLHRRIAAEERQDMLERVHASAVRLERTLTEVIELEQFDQQVDGHMLLSEQALAPLVQMTVQVWVAQTDHHRLDIAVPESAPLVHIDREKFQLALGHILTNALRFSAPDSQVALTLCTSRSAGRAEIGIRVEDHGIGMPRAVLAQAFDRYYRADPHAADRGAGLGLTLVREIMTALGGRITLSSREGKGTTATLWLPRPLAAQHRSTR